MPSKIQRTQQRGQAGWMSTPRRRRALSYSADLGPDGRVLFFLNNSGTDMHRHIAGVAVVAGVTFLVLSPTTY
jgi:hypothetical protein